jgi:hypothetical protein
MVVQVRRRPASAAPTKALSSVFSFRRKSHFSRGGVVLPSVSSARAKFCARGFLSAASTFYVRDSDRAG